MSVIVMQASAQKRARLVVIVSSEAFHASFLLSPAIAKPYTI
jgi:hypothetical protein